MPTLRSFEPARAVAIWLFVVAALVFGMIVLGGATRLTDSGLSITEWKPITGAIPPLSQEAWLQEFAKYQRIPEYEAVNRGMSLDDFKTIYWWEWAHRLLGRVIGLAYAIPFVVFLASRRIPRPLIFRTALLLALGALQGFVGWWMVASGLSDRVDVAPERLTIHLGLALVVFCLLVWTGLDAWAGAGRPSAQRRWRWAALGLTGLVFLQILLGGLVAGNDAGRIYTDWPLMNGSLFPDAYVEGGDFFRSLLHSQGAVQFNHRVGAYLLFAASLVAAVSAMKSRRLPVTTRRLTVALAVAVTCQALLGIATLTAVAPFGLSLLHQILAVVVLAVAVWLTWRASRA